MRSLRICVVCTATLLCGGEVISGQEAPRAAGEKRAEEKPAEKGAGEKRAGEKRAGEKRADEKPAEKRAGGGSPKRPSQAESIAAAEKRFAGLKQPNEGGGKALARFIAELKLHRPRSYGEFIVLQSKIRAAANRILEVEKDQTSETYRDALTDAMETSSALISLADPASQAEEYRVFRKQLGKVGALSVREVDMAVSVARALENAESYKLAEEALGDFADLFAAGDRTRKYASVFQKSLKRVRLVGETIEVEGQQLDGSEFELDALKGKVVLVDFWATWCGPCVAEIPNLKKLYAEYKPQGFEIVGISLDERREPLEQFVKTRKLPWIVLHDRDTPGRNEAAIRYDVLPLPAMFLLDRRGRVISLNARGERLAGLLKREFAAAK